METYGNPWKLSTVTGAGCWQLGTSSSRVLAPLLLVLALAPVLPGPIQGGQAPDRQADPVAVCVVAPRVEAVQQGDAIGLVPTPRPVLLVVEPLLEIRLERAGRLVWRRLASPGRVVPGDKAGPGRSRRPWEVGRVPAWRAVGGASGGWCCLGGEGGRGVVRGASRRRGRVGIGGSAGNEGHGLLVEWGRGVQRQRGVGGSVQTQG